MEKPKVIIGADISKRSIDLSVHPHGEHLRISNDPPGFKQVIQLLRKLKLRSNGLIMVMEYTGWYSSNFERFLFKRGIPFSKVNPVDIKYSIGVTRGKSDKVDASRIARYAAEKLDRLKIYEAPSKSLEDLSMLNTSRDKLVRTRAGLKNSIEMFKNAGLSDSHTAVQSQLRIIKALDKEIKKLDHQIEETIKQEERLKKNYDLLTSIKGVGPVVATNVLVKTKNFTRFTNSRKFACYCGVAPFEHSSGTSIQGKRRVSHMADKHMKTLLNLVAQIAIQRDPELQKFYQRKVDSGYAKMSALNIIRNKLLGRMFAVIKRQTPYCLIDAA